MPFAVAIRRSLMNPFAGVAERTVREVDSRLVALGLPILVDIEAHRRPTFGCLLGCDLDNFQDLRQLPRLGAHPVSAVAVRTFDYTGGPGVAAAYEGDRPPAGAIPGGIVSGARRALGGVVKKPEGNFILRLAHIAPPRATLALPNGLELSCPAEAGRLTRIVRPASGQDKRTRKRRPPGQLQRVVRQRQNIPWGELGRDQFDNCHYLERVGAHPNFAGFVDDPGGQVTSCAREIKVLN